MEAVMLQVILSFFTIYSKDSLYVSAKTYEKNIVSKEYRFGRHDDEMCFLPNCRHHIIPIGNIKELLWKLDAFCSNYQQVDCLYTLFNYHFSGKNVVKSGQLSDYVQRAVHFNHQNRGVDRIPGIAKKRFLRKRYKEHLLSSVQKTKSTQTSGLVFADWIEQVEKTKLELELIKNIDCFLDGRGNYTSISVSFRTKSF